MDLLERHFEVALETPDGINKLRELILSLAIQGKLVPQNPKDQPAGELIKEIEEEKNRLIKEGKINKQEPPPIKPEEIPYKLPNCWEWVRFAELVELKHGHQFRQHDFVLKGIPVIKIGQCKTDGTLDLSKCDFIDISREKEFEDYKIFKDDLLMALTGGTLGKVTWVKKDYGVVVQNYRVGKFIPNIKYYNKRFVAIILQSKLFKKLVNENINQNAQPNIGKEKIELLLIPFPPFDEQKSIVAKVDQLMGLCDKLESEREERNSKRVKIHTSAINKLLTSPDKPNFSTSWNFITKNFYELYSVPENVEELKKAILQLAVMGKLVPQDPKDQPASELLKEIEVEKNRLVKEGKVRKQEPLPPIKPEEIPYELPKNWEWVRLNDIADYNGRINANPEDINHNTWVLDLEDIEKDTSVILTRVKYSERQSKSTKSTFSKGDILYGKLRPYLNKVVVADSDGVCTTEIVPIVPYKGIDSHFLKYLLKRSSFITHVNELSYGVKMPRLGTSDAIKSIHPIPPTTEQKRIVAKIDELMKLCATLEEQINESTGKQTAILNAVLARV